MSDVLKLAREHMAQQVKAARQTAIDQRARRSGAKWPIESDSLACHTEQVQERNDFIRGHGLRGVRARRDGTMIFDSHNAREKYLRTIGLVDRNGFR
jgi:hypothetical protein